MSGGKVRDVARRLKKLSRERIQHAVATGKHRYIRKVSWIIEMLAIGCADTAIGVVMIVVLCGLKIYAMWPLVVYGAAFVVARYIVLLVLCPLMIDMARVMVPAINALLWAMVAIVDVGITALDAVFVVVNDIIDIVNFLAGNRLTSFQFALVKWVKRVPQITLSEYETVFRTLPVVCTKFNSMPAIVDFFMKYSLHKYTCPVVRFLWPLPTVYRILDATLSWTYYGSPQPNPFLKDANCAASSDVTGYDFACSGLGVGYVFLEFFLPAIILFIVLTSIGPGLWRMGRASLYVIYLFIVADIDIAFLFIDILTY